MTVQLLLFWIFAAIAVAGAINLILQRHPIHSALSLITVMGALAVEYLLLGAEFIAFIQIIVYAGSIMVLFVFVIMVLNAGEVAAQPNSKIAAFLAMPLLTALGILLAGQLYAGYRQTPPAGAYLVQTGPIGETLFHQFLLPFEVTSILFLVGVLGAVVLAARQDQQVAQSKVQPATTKGAAAGK